MSRGTRVECNDTNQRRWPMALDSELARQMFQLGCSNHGELLLLDIEYGNHGN